MAYIIYVRFEFKPHFDPVQIQLMTLTSSTLQIRRHGYSGDLNIIICIDICNKR
ncbi:hypothetical protein MTR_5g094000 [Medicago truncatula]|uniref:Uncharacterized protein n=1 Tax=Medicago truncatula TaxID=3880 RepID=G7K4A1_MEDTR|nr:hypothetical protein MTR_5g094000 [Medicago truncatula]